MKLVHKVRQTIEKYSLLETGDRVIVGLSGGPDSMVLLDVLCSLQKGYQLTLVPAHLNHGFRGEEAEADLRFCEEAAAGYGLRLVSESADLPSMIAEKNLSPQAAARDTRYDFFFRAAKAHEASKIALGHHADDQAETFLMRLLRGAGTRGLRGIPVRREPGIIRPLLHVTREEILNYLKEKGIAFRQDSSNKKAVYLRNRIRQELLPLLVSEYNPNLVADLERTAEILGEEDDFLEDAAGKLFVPIRIPHGTALDLTAVSGIPHALLRRIVRLVIARAVGGLSGITFSHVESVMRLMQAEGSSAGIDLPRGLTVRKVYERLEFCRNVPEEVPTGLYEIPVPGRDVVSALKIEVESEILSSSEVPASDQEGTALFDLDKCSLPLGVRTRRPGDVFYPRGFEKKKKVKRFFIDEKVPFKERDRVPLLVNRDDQILWVGGYRTDARFAADAGTLRALLVRIRQIKGAQHEESR